MKLRLWLLGGLVCAGVSAQTLATFGTPIAASGTLLDLVLDERRQYLYLVNFANDQVEVYSLVEQRFLNPIPVGRQPVSAAIAPDGQYLYVTSFGASSLSAVDLSTGGVTTVGLVAQPEGVAVGFDGRVLITTLGTGPPNQPQNTLLIYDRTQTGTAQIAAVPVPPPATQNPTGTPFIPGRPFLNFRGRLHATRDGRFIIGMNTPNNNSTVVFVYEAASGTVLRTRLTPGLSSVLSVSPEGARFMAGLRLFESSTLSVVATTNALNAPFQIPGTFNLNQNVGGSIFSSDGTTLYSAFNVAPFALPQPRPNSALLLISNPRNLAITMGIRLPENILGRMVMSSDGANIYALSESGVLALPVGRLYEHPILAPASTAVRLSANACDRGFVSTEVKIDNAGAGRLTFTFAQPGQTLLAQAISGVAPSAIRLSLNPRVSRNPGTTVTNLVLQSPDAINIPPVIRVYENFQTGGQLGETFPIEMGYSLVTPQTQFGPATVWEGLIDMEVDNRRGRVYLANSSLNRIEVFDFRNRRMLPPIEVGQLPRSMAMSSDGSLLYVANSGGEWISIVDLNQRQQVGKVDFPPAPFNFNQAPVAPRSIARGIFGPQFVGSNGTIWSVRSNTAVIRLSIPVINPTGAPMVTSPAHMVSTPGTEAIVLMNNTGIAYRYDSISDTYTISQTVMTNPIDSFYGPLAGGPEGRYFLANRAILNSLLAPTGGRTTGSGSTPGGAVGAGLRHQPAVAAVNGSVYARFSVPPQQNPFGAPVGDPRPLVELIDPVTEATLTSVAAPEGPPLGVFGNNRVNLPPRLMGVDSGGTTAFLITASGLSVVSLRQPSLADRPVINPGGVVHAATFSRSISPGALVTIFGRSLAERATAGELPLPEVLGGSCVTFNDVALPLLSASPTQINAQLPPDFLPGAAAVAVRSVTTGLQSEPMLVNVTRLSPGIFTIGGNRAAVFHGADFRPVTAADPGRRGEVLVAFASGLPPGYGQELTPGAPAPANPLVTTLPPRLFIGDPDQRESEMVVEWSGFTPGFIGLNQINFRVPPNAGTGDELLVLVRVEEAESPRAGPLAPVTSLQ